MTLNPTCFLSSEKCPLYLHFSLLFQPLNYYSFPFPGKRTPKKTSTQESQPSETSNLIIYLFCSFIVIPKDLGHPSCTLSYFRSQWSDHLIIDFHVFLLFGYMMSQVRSPSRLVQSQIAKVTGCTSPGLSESDCRNVNMPGVGPVFHST